MALPKIQSPIFNIDIPSLNKLVEFRPFLVKEEKILLMAQQSADEREIVRSIKQIINNCCLNPDINVNDLTMVDLEYTFLKLRARSVNNIVEVKYVDQEDNKNYEFSVNLDDVVVTEDKKVSNKIQLNDGIGIIMKHLNASIIDDMKEFEDEIDILNFFVKKSIIEIYDEETVYPVNEQTDEDLQIFIDSMDVKSFDKIREFINSAPKLSYTIKYTNSLDNEKEIVLDSLRDFFILR